MLLARSKALEATGIIDLIGFATLIRIFKIIHLRICIFPLSLRHTRGGPYIVLEPYISKYIE